MEIVRILAPLFLFTLLPLLIPLSVHVCGALYEKYGEARPALANRL